MIINYFRQIVLLRACLNDPLSQDEMRGGVILMYWNKSRLMIQQNITIFLGVDCSIFANQRMLKQQQ